MTGGIKNLLLVMISLAICASSATAVTIVNGDATNDLGPDFFFDTAATGGSDVTINQDVQGTGIYVRDFGSLNSGSLGSDISITGFAWASSASTGANDLTSAMVTFTYLGLDGAVGGGDDVLLGSVTDNYTQPHGGAGEYVWEFDSALTGSIDGLNSLFQIEIAPMNGTNTGSVRFKSVGGPKFTVAGTSTALGALAAEWVADADGGWNTGSNWSIDPDVPGVGGSVGSPVSFGNAITAPRTVTLDVNADIPSISFDNANAYTISGGNTITLSGPATISSAQGEHNIASTIAGSNGIQKLGAGALQLDGVNTFTGDVTISSGRLDVSSDANLGNAANGLVFEGATMRIEGTTLNTISRSLTLNGNANINVFDATNDVDFTGSVSGSGIFVKAGDGGAKLSNAASFDGDIHVNQGTFTVDTAGGLGTTNGVTKIDQNGGTLVIDGSGGNLSLAETIQNINGRASSELAHIVNAAGDNSLTGTVNAGGGQFYNIESQAGELEITGDIIMPTTGDRTLRLSGAGDGRITSNITNGNTNLGVEKTGSGTWTIRPSFSTYSGLTTVEEGTLAVENDGSGFNVLQGSIDVEAGATFDTSSFVSYELPANSTLSGGGQVNAGTEIEVFDDTSITPGDSVGTLSINGDLRLTGFSSFTGSLNFELGDTTTVGGGVNDLIDVSGNLELAGGGFNVNVTPVAGGLAAGPYTLIDATGGTASTTSFGAISLVALDGTTALNSRITSGTVSRSGDDLVANFTGAAENIIWNGSASSDWDVAASINWFSSDGQFRDLDNVTFGDGAATTDVNVVGVVSPGDVTFSNTSGNYRIVGTGSVLTGGTLSVTGGQTATIANAGGSQFGDVQLTSGALEVRNNTSITGNVSGTGELRVTDGTVTAASGLALGSQTLSGRGTVVANVTTTSASVVRVGGVGGGTDIVRGGLQLNYDAARDVPGDGFWNDEEPNAGEVNLLVTNPGSPVAVSDGTFQQLSAAYDISSTGLINAPGSQNTYFDGRATSSGTFEVVFNVTNTAAGASQVLLDIGGGRGLSLILDDDTLSANVNGDGDTSTISTTVGTGWHQAVVVVNDADPADGNDDSFTLYVNNTEVATLTNLNIDDWSGGNNWGIGGVASVTLAPDGSPSNTLTSGIDFHGDVAVTRYYFGGFDSADVAQNYAALLDATPLVPAETLTIDGDFDLVTDATLEIDIFGEDNNDLLEVTGSATLSGLLDISLVNAFAPLAEQSFTVLTAAGGITDGGLSLIGDGSFAFSIVNGTDLVLSLAAADLGDYNGDGIVDGADYTVWRDTLGDVGAGLAADGDGNGVIDNDDYSIWRANFGNDYTASLNGPSEGAVPEPSTVALCLLAAISGFMIRRR